MMANYGDILYHRIFRFTMQKIVFFDDGEKFLESHLNKINPLVHMRL